MQRLKSWVAMGVVAALLLGGNVFGAGDAAAAVAGSPIGHLDYAAAGNGIVTMRGWSFDPDHLAAEQVQLVQTAPARKLAFVTSTTVPRPDVNRVYRVSGVHGWAVTFAAAPGRGTFCAYGINSGPGATSRLGCAALTVGAGSAPTGHLDTVSVTGPQVTMSGWALDRDTPSSDRVDLWQIYPTRQFLTSVTTSISRADVNAAYHVIGNHGWDATFTVADGQHTVCAYAINSGPARPNTKIGCSDVLTPNNTPAGPVTGLQASVTATTARLSWANPVHGYYTGITIERLRGAQPPTWNYPHTQLADLPPGATSFTDTGLVTGATYSYALFTHDSLGNSAGATITVTATVVACTTVCAWGVGPGAFGAGANEPLGSTNPVPVANLSTATAVTGMNYGGMALKADGTVWTWGLNDYGELGNGTTIGSSSPVQVSGLTGVTSIAATAATGFALRSDGTVWVWGRNQLGQFGFGNNIKQSSVPEQYPRLTGVVAIAASYLDDAYALRSDGTVFDLCGGRVGPVYRLAGVTAIATGEGTGYALLGDGTVWAWGDNSYGQLGNGSQASFSVYPVQVTGLTNVIAINAAYHHAGAVRSDGTVWTWGDNHYGQLGHDGTTDTSVPGQIPQLANITALASTYATSYALTAAGTVQAWGSNSEGGYGNQTTSDSPTPVTIPGLSHVTAIGAGLLTGYAAHAS